MSSPKGEIANETQIKIRSWYRYQIEIENISSNIHQLQDKLQSLREKQEPVEEDVIDALEISNNQKRPLQIGNDWFCIKQITSQDTPLTYASLEKLLLSYFAGDTRRRDDCLHFIKSQRENRIISRTISRINPVSQSPLIERTESNLSNIAS